MKKTALLTLFLFSVILGGTGLAQDVTTEEIILEEAPYPLPEIAPGIYLSGGYRSVSVSGSERAVEYEYLHDSLSLAGELRVFSFPHRVHLDVDIENVKDYFGDVSYAYKDIVLFRGINRTLFHNLDNINLIDLDPTTSSPGVDVRDGDEKYGVQTGMNSVFLRLKTPDFPFHVYLDGSLITKDGTQQQRSLLGSGYFNDIVRTSQKRNIDWQTKALVIGANTHFGPIEIDIAHGEKRFDVYGDKVMYDIYGPAGFLPNIIRPGGIFPHNLIPELKGSSNTLKIHTSYTGSLVASATLSKTDRENRDSGAKAEYFIGAGEVVWMPMPRLTFFLKYRHKETDIDNPDFATITDISNPSNTITSRVRPSISSIADTLSGIVRYRPIRGLTLRAEYSYENVKRENADEWKLPESTTRNIASLSADMRIVRSLNLKARYTHKEIDTPAYNIEPDRSDEGKISLSWIPLPKINALVSYSIAKEKRNDLHFPDSDENAVEGAKNRDVKRDKLLGSITFLISKDLSLTTSYAYIRNKTKQDIVFLSETLTSLTDPLVPHKDTAHNYSLDLNYLPGNNISLNAGVSHTISSGTFYPSSSDLLEPVSIASFSEVKIRETVYSLNGEYRLKNGIALGMHYKYSKISDVIGNPHDDINDGTAHILLLTISKRW